MNQEDQDSVGAGQRVVTTSATTYFDSVEPLKISNNANTIGANRRQQANYTMVGRHPGALAAYQEMQNHH